MKARTIISIWFILLPALIYAQNFLDPSAEVKANQDNLPSTFIQSGTRIFGSPGEKLISVWTDYREGEPSFYGQAINYDGGLYGTNFIVEGNLDAELMKDGRFIILSESFLNTSKSKIHSVIGNIYTAGNTLLKKVELFSSNLPVFAEKFTIDPLIQKFNSGFFYSHVLNGAIYFASCDDEGNVTSTTANRDDLPVSAVKYSTAFQGTSIFFPWLSSNDFLGSPGTGLYLSKLDSDFNYLKKELPIKQYSGINERSADVVSSVFSDNTLGVFLIDCDSAKIEIFRVDEPAENFFRQNILDFTYPENFTPIGINSFSISKEINNSFILLASIEGANNQIFNILLKVSSDGFPIGDLFTNSEKIFFTGKKLLCPNENLIVISEDIDNDAYVSTINNFQTISQIKVNTDSKGGNESQSLIFNVDDNMLFINYEDEIQAKGRFVLLNGTTLTNEYVIPGRHCAFFENNKNFAFYNEYSDGKAVNLVFTIFSRSWNELESRILYEGGADIKVKKISSSTCALLASTQQKTELTIFDSEGLEIKRILLKEGPSVQLNIWATEDGSYWINLDEQLQLFSSALDPVSEIFNVNYHSYIGDGRFLKIGWIDDGTGLATAGQTMNADGTEPSAFFTISGQQLEEAQIKSVILSKHQFLTCAHDNGQIFAKTLGIKGEEIMTIRINEEAANYAKDPDVLKFGSNIVFAWSEAKYPGLGYDIFFRHYPMDDLITGLDANPSEKLDFNLSQNYPNPFNPSTVINFTLPDDVNTTLKIYNLLGKEITTLINDYLSAGNHSFTFDATEYSLPSGIYFYRITAGQFSDTKKFVLIK